mmetsp:Transcript_128681/g.223115  ORF Transcript_128681/g.223115 Transcript_128681/m.223115 type:complete len:130 (-) Transcript_128681:68-457(-)
MKLIALLGIAGYVAVESLVVSDIQTPCSGITCPAVTCVEPFVVKTPEETGSCCAMCDTDKVDYEDRSWTKDLTGGVGPNNNADLEKCRTVFCPPLTCPETEQMFDGRCCTKCPSSALSTYADFAAGYKF